MPPWQISDVERHNSGLSNAKKRQWVRVANSALRRCMSDGGSQSSCEGSAIRQANSVVARNQNAEIEHYSTEVPDYTIRYEDLDGHRHMVVPVVMMVEGVHNGSQGPVYHSTEELGRWPGSWNGIPVTVPHPQDEDGNYVSANEPERVANMVGRIYRAHMEDGRLMAEAWLDESKLRRVSPQALGYIREGRPLEVSIGAFTDTEDDEGEWHGERYEAVARNHRPDHLALLPGGRGACSWDDGCGIRAHEDNDMNRCDACKDHDEPCGACKWVATNAALKEAMKTTGPLCVMAEGYRETMMRLQAKLDEMDGNGRFHFLVEATSEWLVYEVRREEGSSDLYKVGYSMNDDQVELGDDRTLVRRKTTTEYVEANEEAKEGDEMKKADRVKALIANEQTRFTEQDKEFLEGLSDEQLEKLEPVEVKPEQQPSPQGNGITREQAVEVLHEEFSDPEKVMGLLPPQIRAQMQHGLRAYEEGKQNLITGITKATDVYNEEELQALDYNALDRLHKAIVRPVHVNFGGSLNGNIRSSEIVPLCPPGVEDDTQ